MNHKIAVWPITVTFIDLLEAAPALGDENVYFVDSSCDKQGTTILGKEILSPDIIPAKDIDTVIISTSTKITIDSIKKVIAEKYPSVSVKTVNELCMPSH